MNTTRVKTKTLDEQIDALWDELLTGFDMDFKGVSDQSGRTAPEIDRQIRELCELRGPDPIGVEAMLEREGIIGITPSGVPIRRIDRVQCGLEGEVCVIGVANRISPRDHNEPVYVAKRGGRKMPPPTRKLNLFLRDDYDEILCIVDRFNFARLGLPVIERGRPAKGRVDKGSIYAVRGTVPRDFRMISVTSLRYLGDMKDSRQTTGQVKRNDRLDCNREID